MYTYEYDLGKTTLTVERLQWEVGKKDGQSDQPHINQRASRVYTGNLLATKNNGRTVVNIYILHTEWQCRNLL